MLIGIDASRAFIAKRTGIEEYSYQVIKHLRDEIKSQQVVLYIRPDQAVDFDLPENWKIKKLWAPRFWTQIRLSLEMCFYSVDVLFVPAHTIPIIHPEKTVVTIHGLEYEFCPAAYSPWERFYMRLSIKNSCRWASRLVAVSENTKKDLMDLYKVPAEKIEVVYEGYEKKYVIASEDANDNSRRSVAIPQQQPTGINNINELRNEIAMSSRVLGTPRNDSKGEYLLFIGRLEERKNIVGIIKSFEILKEHYKIPHRLILAGKFGYGAEKIQEELKNTNCGQDIILRGYVSAEEKWELLKNTDVFLFPTFYEGFGLPILEAQSVGVPVVASNNSAIPEISTNYESNTNLRIESALLVDPMNAEEIADAVYKLISDEGLKNAIIKKGYENVKRFSWDKCAREIAQVLTK